MALLGARRAGLDQPPPGYWAHDVDGATTRSRRPRVAEGSRLPERRRPHVLRHSDQACSRPRSSWRSCARPASTTLVPGQRRHAPGGFVRGEGYDHDPVDRVQIPACRSCSSTGEMLNECGRGRRRRRRDGRWRRSNLRPPPPGLEGAKAFAAGEKVARPRWSADQPGSSRHRGLCAGGEGLCWEPVRQAGSRTDLLRRLNGTLVEDEARLSAHAHAHRGVHHDHSVAVILFGLRRRFVAGALPAGSPAFARRAPRCCIPKIAACSNSASTLDPRRRNAGSNWLRRSIRCTTRHRFRA